MDVPGYMINVTNFKCKGALQTKAPIHFGNVTLDVGERKVYLWIMERLEAYPSMVLYTSVGWRLQGYVP